MGQIEAKVYNILRKNNFYAYKIFSNNEHNMVRERSELERLMIEA